MYTISKRLKKHQANNVIMAMKKNKWGGLGRS